MLLLAVVAFLVLVLGVFGPRGLTFTMLARVPLLFLGALLVGPYYLTAEGSELFWNLFILETAWGLGFAAALMFPATWVCLGALFIYLSHGETRFGVVRPEPRFLRRLRWWYWFAALPLLPAWLLFSNADLATGESVVAAVGIAVGFVALYFVAGVAAFRLVHWYLESEATSAIRELAFRLTFGRFGPWARDGYVDEMGKLLPAHVRMSALLSGFLVVYAVCYWATYPGAGFLELPTIAFILLLFTWTCALVAGLTFFLDRFRVPLLIALVLLLSVVASWRDSDHYYRVYDLEGSDAGLGHARDTLLAWADVQKTPEPPVVLVCAEGGGIQAASWTAIALTGLHEELGADFTRSIRLVSGVSGGSVGLLHFLRALDARGDELDGEAVRAAANESALGAVGWGLVYPDFLRVGAPIAWISPMKDRAWAVEELWRGQLASLTGDDAARPVRLSRWVERARAGDMPEVVFNTTVVETGEQLLFKTYSLGDLERRPSADSAELPRGFFTTYAGKDVEAVTAARLSATFPYVTPAARARGAEPSERFLHPPLHVVDGGYFDNVGVASAGLWLWSCFMRLDEKSPAGEAKWSLDREALDRVGDIWVLLLRPFPRTSKELDDPRGNGWSTAAFGPLMAVLNTRTSSQVARNRRELDALGLLLSEPPMGDRLHVVELRPNAPDDPAELEDLPFSLSWHLTRRQIARNVESWEELIDSDTVAALRSAFGE